MGVDQAEDNEFLNIYRKGLCQKRKCGDLGSKIKLRSYIQTKIET